MEVIVTSENSGQLWNFCVWDPLTGTALRSFKGGISCSRTLTTISCDYLISAQKDKPIIQVWAMNRQDQATLKMIVPGIIQALAISPCGSFCVGGAAEQLFVWLVSTGRMMACLRRHYQNVNGVFFTSNSCNFVSIGADGLVLLWNMETVLDSSSGEAEPEFSWSDHSQAVTSIYITKSLISPLIFTVSLDQTCKVHDLFTGKTLLNVQLNEPLHSVTVDNGQQKFFVGSASGKIFMIDLLNPPREINYSPNVSARKFIGHEKAVTCLSVYIDGSLLLSGSDDSSARVWDIDSGQCLRILVHRGPLTNAFFCPKFKHFEAEKFKPRKVVAQFEKKLDPDAPFTVDVWTHELPFQDAVLPRSPADDDEQLLRNDVAQLKRINSDIYQFAVDNLMKKRK